ncbi:MAG: hypothetical protein AB1762_09120 [Gemmatimonadota bacterium]
MHFDELKADWLKGDDSSERTDDVIARVRARATELHRAIRKRDRLEIITAAVLLPLFLWLAYETRFVASKIGALIVAISCVTIPLRLRAAQRSAPDYTLPLQAMLRAELESAHAQRRLLSTIAWWYAGPIWVGVTLFMIGPLSVGQAIAVTVGSTLFMSLVVAVNRSAVRTQIEPRIAELRALLDG